MVKKLDYELAKSASIIINELALAKAGETVVITADTMSDETIVDAVAAAAFAAGAKPMVVWTATPGGVGKAGDKDLPVKALGSAIGGADIWIEFNYQWLVYSSSHELALSLNKNLRHICLVGMDAGMMDRLIGKVPVSMLADFQMKVTEMTKAAKHVKITTPSGCDLEFDNDHNCPFYCELGIADHPGSAYLSGQICWFPVNESLSGTLVFDGSINPPCGLLTQPVVLTVKKRLCQGNHRRAAG